MTPDFLNAAALMLTTAPDDAVDTRVKSEVDTLTPPQ